MANKFHSFVIFAAMRTGSNFLEASLDQFEGVTCYGEVFNPRFIGKAGQQTLLGTNLRQREMRPEQLYDKILSETDGLAGLRYFQDHHKGVLNTLINDPACAKIILTRNPLDSFVSFEIASSTEQWTVGENEQPQAKTIKFRPYIFKQFLSDLDEFYAKIRRDLQLAGQSAFEISYDEIADVAVLNGLASWLGLEEKTKAPSSRYRRQNPPDLAEKVENIETVDETLQGFDPFGLYHVHKPTQIWPIPYRDVIVHQEIPLLYIPIRPGPDDTVLQWMSSLSAKGRSALKTGLSVREYHHWITENPGYRSFTVLQHPLERAHRSLYKHFLLKGPDRFGNLRGQLKNYYLLDFPMDPFGPDYDRVRHRQVFIDFLGFIRRNVRGLTSVRVDPSWDTQESLLETISKIRAPDMILREDNLAAGLGHLALDLGLQAPEMPALKTPNWPYSLADIYDEETESAARLAYDRDYLAFGFSDWAPAMRP